MKGAVEVGIPQCSWVSGNEQPGEQRCHLLNPGARGTGNSSGEQGAPSALSEMLSSAVTTGVSGGVPSEAVALSIWISEERTGLKINIALMRIWRLFKAMKNESHFS